MILENDIAAHEAEQTPPRVSYHSPFSLAFEQAERELGARIGWPAMVYAPTVLDDDQQLQLEEQDYIHERTIAQLRADLADAEARVVRARNEIEAYRAVVSDATRRYSYLYDGWRKAKSNNEVAEAVRAAMFDWETTRERLYGPLS